MQHLTAPPRPDGTSTADLDPVVAALNTQEAFTREQVAWLMSEAMRWGYDARVDEENAAYPPPKLVMGKWFDQAAERQKADATARLPRPGDFKGREATPLRVAA